MTGRDPGHARLERRYRRLLAAYPWEHRRVYEDEMVEVLLAGARPGQRLPSPGDVADVLLAALRHRLVAGVTELGGPDWRDAAAVVGVLTAVVGLATELQVVVFALPHLRHTGIPLPHDELALAGLWLATLVAALAAPRRVVLATGALLLAASAIAAYRTYGLAMSPGRTVATLGLAVCAALALGVPAPAGRAAGLLGRWRLGVLGVAMLIGVAGSAAPVVQRMPGGGVVVGTAEGTVLAWGDVGGYRSYLAIRLLLAAGIGAVLLGVVVTLQARLRRRVLAILAGPLSAVVAARAVTDGFTPWSPYGWMASGPWLSWPVLLGTPLLVFMLAVPVLRRRERSLRLLALGRAAERQRAGG